MEKDTPLDRLSDAIFPLFIEALRRLAAMPADARSMDVEAEVSQEVVQAEASAYARALEAMDEELCACLPEGTRVHDARSRTIATRVGDVTFRRRRCIDRAGNLDIPLDSLLELPPNARMSPEFESEIVWLAAGGSYQRAADVAAFTGSSRITRNAVMGCMRRAGRACEKDDARRERSLWKDGVLPGGGLHADELCVESDGTVVSLQHADGRRHAEMKAMVACAGKERHGKKVRRIHPVSFGCTGTPDRMWRQGIAAAASVYDLSAVGTVHSGFDGASWCSGGLEWLRDIASSAKGHLDPFHVNRIVSFCFGREHEEERLEAMKLVYEGDAEGCASLLERMAQEGAAKPEQAHAGARYLRNHAGSIGVPGPSLGTMEAENQHVYKSKMASVPCAWSEQGASDMARIRSRQASGRPIPHLSPEERRSARRRDRRKRKEESILPSGPAASCAVASEGRGYEYPVRGSVEAMGAEVRYRSGC